MSRRLRLVSESCDHNGVLSCMVSDNRHCTPSALHHKRPLCFGLAATWLTQSRKGTVSGTLRVAYIQPPVTLSLQPLKTNVRIIPLTPLPPTLVAETLNSAVSWLSARLLGTDKKVSRHVRQGEWQTQTLEVILSPETPVGKMQTQLTLTLPSGQRLVLPVSALVEARKPLR